MRFPFTPVLILGYLSLGGTACDESHGSNGEAAGPTGPSRTPTAVAAARDSGGGGGGGQTVTYVSKGDAASGYWFDSQWDSSYTYYTYVYGYVNVSRGGSPSAQTTFLSYSVQHCSYDFVNYINTCSDDAAGYGTIPNSAFSGGGRQFRLRLTAGQAPGFLVYAGTGSVELSFTVSGLYSTSSNGVTSTQYGSFSYQTTGQWSSSAANLTGNLGGVTVPATVQASVGKSQSTTIWHFHG